MERHVDSLDSEPVLPNQEATETEAPAVDLADITLEQDLFREQVELAAREEEERLKLDAVDQRASGGFLTRLAGYRNVINVFRLASVLAGFAGRKTPEQLQDIGSIVSSESTPEYVGTGEVELLNQIKEKPALVASQIGEFKDAPFAEVVITSLAESQPGILFDHLTEIQNEPYFQSVIDTLVVSDPEYSTHVVTARHELGADPNTQLVRQGIDSSSNPEVTALGALATSDLDFGSKRFAAEVFQYVFDNGLSPEQAKELVNNEHALVDALLYTVQNGNEGEGVRAEGTLRDIAEDNIMEMNLRFEQTNRFESIQDATANELYATIVFGGEDARPSTSKELFNRLFQEMDKGGNNAITFIDGLQGVEYHQFVNLAANSGKFDDFLTRATPEQQQELIKRFVDVRGEDLEKNLSAVSQVLIFSKDTALLGEMKQELERQFLDAERSGDKKAEAAFGILSGLLGKEATWLSERASEFEVNLQDSLSTAELFNERGENVQAYYFFNDDDGYSSFTNFIQEHRAEPGWKIEDKGTFVEVKKTQEDRTILIYANKPMASVGGETEFMAVQDAASAEKLMDAKQMNLAVAHVPESSWAEGRPDGFQDMNEYMDSMERSPDIQVHRGHVYWNSFTYDEVRPDVKLMFDGSCGGSNDIEKVTRKAPDAQVLYNSQEGMTGINDSILSNINDRILAGQDVVWSDVRQKTERDIGVFYDEDREPEAMGAFNKYIFPDENKAKAAIVEAKFHELTEEGENI